MGVIVALTALACISAAAGCNAVLGNKEARLLEGDSSIPVPSTDDDAGPGLGSDAATVDDASPEADVIAPTEDGAPTCGAGKKYCSGECVSTTDPVYGCAAAGCTPCSVSRATASCAGGACAVLACNTGYSDCNQDPSDGCETDLSEATHCGACNAQCGTVAPLCAPNGAGFSCTSGCSGQAPTLCGTQCVDLTNSRTHCGQCNNSCPAVGNAQVSCSGSACAFACDTGFHACGSTCAANSDVGNCGSTCGTACTAGPNATAGCNGTSCTAACVGAFKDCSASVPGCESDSMSDPVNCGGCGISCNGEACVGGICNVPVPDAGND
jgi:hypothetical protein